MSLEIMKQFFEQILKRNMMMLLITKVFLIIEL